MYAPSRTSSFAIQSGTARVSVTEDRESFRPVALPALAAAVHVNAAAVKAARAKAAGKVFRIVHEDEPVD
ncbi:hypothetical protein [Methylorubrum salsuginis]|uniref:Uncharacterized protein n=1 Tax=Methylorubrum salsuginis TaxID=414703 RepID=A0A1I4J9N8_9HYPH|nr:hypothetical protein [Methylorubrum salsuginis]SFL62903.1 hypothetical protein SAMN04488125_11974 [Methylorubrum salsuginis]